MTVDSGENYSAVRASLNLYDYETRAERAPTNAEVLRLLDALHDDITGHIGTELTESRYQRYMNS